MIPRIPTSLRRLAGTAIATAILAGSLAGTASAASPAGDDLDADFDFRDIASPAVIAVYPYSDSGKSTIAYFRVKGPEVAALGSYPQPKMGVKWQVIVKVSKGPGEPFKVDSKTGWRIITADKVGDMERFKNRTVEFKDRTGKQRVRLVSKLVWLAEDGGSKGWVKKTYGAYDLAQSTGLIPSFGADYPTRNGSAPNTYTFS
jgi:hypothetical protein